MTKTELRLISVGTGHDGDYQMGVPWPDPRFTDNEDGTVTDNLTGLIWLEDADYITTNYSSYDNDGVAGDGKYLGITPLTSSLESTMEPLRTAGLDILIGVCPI